MTDTHITLETPTSDTPLWQWVEDRTRRVAHRYGYQEIRLPILESAELYALAGNERQAFGADGVVLRPDGTPGCIKAVIKGRGAGRQDAQRCWYQGPMFRQGKDGPLQFNQFGVEAFGMPGAEIDAELILLTWDMFSALGLNRKTHLEINTLGTWSEQAASKGEKLGADSRRHFASLCHILETAGVAFTINPELTSGRGYYTRTVFEWTLLEPLQHTVLASGGRYDDLAGACCGRPLFASGFALDFEHLMQCVHKQGGFETGIDPQIILRIPNPEWGVEAVLLSQRLRRQLPALSVRNDLAGVDEAGLPASTAWIVTLCADHCAEVWSREHDEVRRVPLNQVVDLVAGRSRAGEPRA
jgi:histidyl-tRNA synthetase